MYHSCDYLNCFYSWVSISQIMPQFHLQPAHSTSCSSALRPNATDTSTEDRDFRLLNGAPILKLKLLVSVDQLSCSRIIEVTYVLCVSPSLKQTHADEPLCWVLRKNKFVTCLIWKYTVACYCKIMVQLPRMIHAQSDDFLVTKTCFHLQVSFK